MARTTLPVLNGGIVELSTTELTKSINELAGQVKELVEDNKKSSEQDEKQTQSLEALSKNFCRFKNEYHNPVDHPLRLDSTRSDRPRPPLNPHSIPHTFAPKTTETSEKDPKFDI